MEDGHGKLGQSSVDVSLLTDRYLIVKCLLLVNSRWTLMNIVIGLA